MAAMRADGEASYVADKLAHSAVESRPPTLHGFPRIGFGIPHQPNKRCRCFGCFNATQVQALVPSVVLPFEGSLTRSQP